MIYLFLVLEGKANGPHKSYCMTSSFLHALNFESIKRYFLFFHRIHASKGYTFLGMVGNPDTPFFFNK